MTSRQPTPTCANQRKPTQISANQRQPTPTNANQRKSTPTNANQRKLTQINANQRKSTPTKPKHNPISPILALITIQTAGTDTISGYAMVVLNHDNGMLALSANGNGN